MALQKGLSWFRRQGAPITVCIIASMVVMSIVWLFSLETLLQFLLTSDWKKEPWTLLTYPWADFPYGSAFGILGFVFMIMWMFYTGSSVERDLGGPKYAALWIFMILVPALFIGLLGPQVGFVGANGMALPVAALTIVWSVRNPHAQIMLYGILPLSGKILGWITVVATLLMYGRNTPLFGLICALHLIPAWAFAANKLPFVTYSRGATGSFGKPKIDDRPFLKKTDRMDKSYYDDVNRRTKEREEREKLRKLFESSMNDDKDKDR